MFLLLSRHGKMASNPWLITLMCLTGVLGLGAESCILLEGACKSCPSGWIQFQESCYMLHHSQMDWADAERHCTTAGGNLPSVHTKEEYDFLRKTVLMLTGKHQTIWLGGYDAAKEGVWLWSDGSFFDFKFWGKGEPSNHHGRENCMEMNFLGRDYVNDIRCDGKKAFFCEKHQ